MQEIDWKYVLFDPRGRIGAQDYWIGVAVIIVGNVLAGVLPLLGPLLWLGLIYVGVCVYGKRLHDTGRTAFWHVVPWLVSMGLVLFGLFVVSAAAIIAALSQGDINPVSLIQAGGSFLFLLILSELVWLIYTIWLGLASADPDANAHGPAPAVEGLTQAAETGRDRAGEGTGRPDDSA
ncbi:DUF805 domain-containing protein [Maricaulis sp. CAU 1757]